MQLDIIRAIQQFSNPALDVVMECFTIFGEKMILAAVFCAIYWCFDKRLGRFLAVALGVSVCVNGVIKDIFRVERIFGEPGIISRRVETATGYSFPSGHTQTAATFWGGLCLCTKRPRLRVAAAVLVLMVGFSRIYLGVHYPTDVIGGLLIGLICTTLLYYAIIARVNRPFVLLICAIAAVLALCLGKSDDTFKGAGILAGILGGLYFEEKLAGFEVTALFAAKKLLRFALGMSLVGIVYIIPKLVFPHTILWDSLRYMLTVFVATGFCPYVFTKLKL